MLPRSALTSRALAARARQALFTLYGFNFPVMVALLQMAVIAPVCYAVARPKLEWGLARGAAPLALVNVLNVVCGLVGARPGGRPCLPAADRDSPRCSSGLPAACPQRQRALQCLAPRC